MERKDMENIVLNNGNRIPCIMFGSFQMKKQEDMDEVVRAAAGRGVFGFDTSPSYQTEKMLAAAVNRLIGTGVGKAEDGADGKEPASGSGGKEPVSGGEESAPGGKEPSSGGKEAVSGGRKPDAAGLKHDGVFKREDFFLDTKIDSWQMIAKKGQIRPYVEASLKQCGMDYWDLLLIHWPQPEYFVKTWLAMEKLYEEGIVKNIGVCNFSVRHFKAIERGGAHYVPMVAQNEIHPLNTEEELTGYCRKNGIVQQAYSPLCRMLPQVKYNALLNILAEKYGVSVAQIVLRWQVEQGNIPVVKTSSAKRVQENTDIFSFSLSGEDHAAISRLDQHFKVFLESRCCPGY